MVNRFHKIHRDVLLQTLLEKSVREIFSPLENFIRKQTTAAFLLVISTVMALILANLPLNNPIAHISEMELGFLFGEWNFTMPLSEWVNSGIMTGFFFIIGLELKRSFIVGELSNPRNASLIIITAIGGMVVPSILYAILNYGEVGVRGWAIPMTTDTAFTIGILAILAKRISITASIFLTALAIFDDIIAILIIAIFYTEQLHYPALLGALSFLVLLIGANKVGITNGFVYAILGIILWACIHTSGIHATLAGLLVAFTVPAKTYLSQESFIDKLRSLLDNFETSKDKYFAMLSSDSQHDLTEEMHKYMKIVSTPLQRWELLFINPIGIIVLPLFALFNAGIVFSKDTVMTALESSVTWGIVAGLVIGKPLGIILFSFIGVKLKMGKLSKDMSMKDVVSIGIVAGVGFTMSIFIVNLAFSTNSELADSAKFGILLASFLSSCMALVFMQAYQCKEQN